MPITVEIVREITDQFGFVVRPRRWMVERFFPWINRSRRLAKDIEATTDSAGVFLYAATVMVLVRLTARASRLSNGRDESMKWHQEKSVHSPLDGSQQEDNTQHDMKTNRLLLSDDLIYFGATAPLVPRAILDKLGYYRRAVPCGRTYLDLLLLWARAS